MAAELHGTFIDKSWLPVYDQYLQGFRTERLVDTDPKYDSLLKNNLMSTYEVMVNTNFHVARMKRPVQNIYKRPI